MRTYVIESHLKDNWFVDLWSDGTVFLWSFNERAYRRFGGMHRLQVGDALDGLALPKYVVRMVNEAYALWDYHREHGDI